MRFQWLILPVLVAAAAPPGPEVCGYVYSVRGDWRLAPQFAVALKQGMEVHAGDQVKLMTEARPGHINVGLLTGKLWEKDCNTDADCRDAVSLPGPAPNTSLSRRLQNLVSGFGSQKPPVVFTLSRGGEGEPAEAVLHLVGDRADLAPALRTMGSVPLKARLIPIASGAPTPEIACPEAQAGGVCLIPVSAAGLYKLEIRVEDRETQAVLVLVAADTDYPRMAETFAEALRVADSWGSGAHADARHYFLSASLNQLALTGKAH